MDWLHGSLASAHVLGSPTVTVHLHDGRAIDVTGLDAAAAIARLKALGVTLPQIARTEWRLPTGTLATEPRDTEH